MGPLSMNHSGKLIVPVLLYGAELWTLSATDENSLGNIFFDEEYRRRINDVKKFIRNILLRMRWLGHVDEDAAERMLFETIPGRTRRWLEMYIGETKLLISFTI